MSNKKVDDNQTRQGDVFTLRRDDLNIADVLKAGALEEQPRPGVAVLAEGEMTGHAHRVFGHNVSLHMMGDLRLLVVQGTEPVTLTHEEHGPITLCPGVHEVRIQRQFAGGVIQRVVD